MSNYKALIDKYCVPFTLITWAIIYYLTSPTTVQTLDSGEMVTNSFFIRPSHQPGYPLFIWIYHIFGKFLSFHSIYNGASLTTVLFSLGTLYFISLCPKRLSPLIRSTIIFYLASSSLFWEYSLLPDVFMLNCFFTSAMCAIHFSELPPQRKFLLLSLVFSIGAANHQTLIFVVPIWFYYFFNNSIKLKLKILITLGSIFITCFIYLSMFLMDDQSVGGWGVFNSFNDVISCFFRLDYGGKLSDIHRKGTFQETLMAFLDFTHSDLFFIFVILVISGVLFIKKKEGRSSNSPLIVIFSLVSYIVIFFSLAKMQTSDGLIDMLSRFFLMPQILFAIVTLSCLDVFSTFFNQWKKLLSFAILIFCIINIFNNYNKLDFSKDHIVEDYGKMVLAELPQNSIYFIQGDTAAFSFYYIQDVLGIRKDITVISSLFYKYQWYVNKVITKHPGVFLRREEALSFNSLLPVGNKANQYFINIDRNQVFFMPTYFKELLNQNIIFKGLSLQILPGNRNLVFQCPPIESMKFLLPSVARFKQNKIIDHNKRYLQNYTACYKAMLIDYVFSGKNREAAKLDQQLGELKTVMDL